jgi:hypothetical protein
MPMDMYVDIVPNRKSRPAILLRESVREGKRIVKRTLGKGEPRDATCPSQARLWPTMVWDVSATARRRAYTSLCAVRATARKPIARWLSPMMVLFVSNVASAGKSAGYHFA